MPNLSPCSTAHSSGVEAHYRKGARPTWHQRRRHRAVLRLLSKVEGTVLDFGCGYGDLAHAISRTHRVQGVDVDPERVAFAAREYAPISFSQCKSDGLPFADQSFDIVASIAVIHFVPDPIRHLQEARRVMRDGGFLLLACSNIQRVRHRCRKLLGRRPAPSPLWLASESQVRDLLQQQGFEIETSEFFYDPPFEGWKYIGDVFYGLIHQVLSLFRVRATCHYFLLLARKTSR